MRQNEGVERRGSRLMSGCGRPNAVALLILLTLLVATCLAPAAQAALPDACLHLDSTSATTPIPSGDPTTIAFDPALARLMAEVSSDKLMMYTSELSGEEPVWLGDPASQYTIATRYSYSPQLEWAAQLLVEHYQSIGLGVEVQRYPDQNWPNVIASLPGTEHPEKVVILSAHFDDRSEIPEVRAPGADDNASGTAALLAIADTLSQHAFAYTIRFAHFSGEEQGMLGSKAYAAGEALAGADIVADINLDMIAWDKQGAPVVEIHAGTDPESLPIANLFSDVVAVYALPLVPEIKTAASMDASDHSSFWLYNYPAVLVIEDLDDFNAHYHTTRDTMSDFNVGYFTAISQASLATTVALADWLDEPMPFWWKVYFPFFVLGNQ